MIPMAGGIRQEPPMAAEQVEVDIRIHGFLADTAVTLVYCNAGRKFAVAGDLYFPLPDGAAVIGYALDVNGTMVDGVAVEKHRARQALETSVRKGIDPGLVECAGGNVFKTRVFPVLPNKTRTIRVRFLSDLLQEERPGLFRLPFCFEEPISQFRLRIEVVKGEGRPRILVPFSANEGLGGSRRTRHADVCLRDAVIREGVVVALPDVDRRRVWLERNPNGETYFVLLDDPPKISSGEVPAPKRVAVYWDASGSREGSHEREMALLRAWFAQWRDAAIEILLVPFRHALDETQVFTVVNGDAGPVLGAIEGLIYDAGTRLGLLPALPAKGEADLAFLFSDGINSLGRPNGKDPSNRPLYVVSDSTAADHARLRFLAMRSGGEYINLDRVGIEDAAARIGRPDMKLLGVDCDPERVGGLIPGLPVPAPADGRLAVAGKLKGPVDLTLRYGTNGKVLSTRSYRIRKRGAAPGDVLRPYWAQRQLADWLMEPEKHRGAIRNLGQTHGLTTPETSLIVLEELKQYLEHQIPPPASLPEMRDRYHASIMKESVQQRESQESWRKDLLRLWNERITWWEKDYPYEEGFTYVPPEKEEAGFDRYDMRYKTEKYLFGFSGEYFFQYLKGTRGRAALRIF
jgi:Ca-activated chloride channel homolog